MHRFTRSLIAGGALAAALVVGTPGSAHAEPAATASETDDLADGQTVTVDYSGFPADATIAVVQCTAAPPASDAECDSERFELGTADPAGAGRVEFAVHTGTVGDDGSVCDGAEHNTCAIVVTDFPVTVSAVVPITFAATGASETTTTLDDVDVDDTAETDETAETGDGAADEAADEDDGGSVAWVVIVSGVALVAILVAVVVLARRRRQ